MKNLPVKLVLFSSPWTTKVHSLTNNMYYGRMSTLGHLLLSKKTINVYVLESTVVVTILWREFHRVGWSMDSRTFFNQSSPPGYWKVTRSRNHVDPSIRTRRLSNRDTDQQNGRKEGHPLRIIHDHGSFKWDFVKMRCPEKRRSN